MSSTSGHAAEDLVAAYLVGQGYKILERNWNTPACELDIVAKRRNRVYIVEVKYRNNDSQGMGFDYVTRAKIKKLILGLEIWCLQSDWNGEVALLAASVSAGSLKPELIEIVL